MRASGSFPKGVVNSVQKAESGQRRVGTHAKQNSYSMSTRMSTTMGSRSDQKNNRPSSQFLAKTRMPYTYVKQAEAPPPNLYRPKFDSVDPNVTLTAFEARKSLPETEIRRSVKPTPGCIRTYPFECSLDSR